MYKKLFSGVWLVLVLALIGNTSAMPVVTWTNGAGDGLWSTAGNWSTGVVPTGGDEVHLTGTVGPTVDSNTTAIFGQMRGPGLNGDMTMNIIGGSLTSTAVYWAFGHYNGHGIVNVTDGATVTISDALYVSCNNANGTLNVSGNSTTIDVGGTMILCNSTDADFSHTYLYSGTLSCEDLTAVTSGNEVLIDIYEGTFIVRNKTGASIQHWINIGYIKAYGGTGTVILEKTTEGWDKLTAIPDPNIAKNPSPADGISVAGDVVLSWSPGDYAVSHDVYLGTDFNDVNNAVRLNGDINGNGWIDLVDVLVLTEQWLQKPADSGPSADLNDDGDIDLVDYAVVADNWMDSEDGLFRGHHTLDANSYDPCGLDLGRTYYWRIDEVNDANSNSPWKGEVWSFTAKYFVLDDFESYQDSNDLRDTWVGNKTGLVHLEETMANDGNSMKYVYDNNGTPFYSEAVRTYDTAQDWTVGGAELLVLPFHGSEDNAADAELMYVALEDDNNANAVVTYNGNMNSLIQEDWEDWQNWIIDLQLFDACGVDLTKIKKFTVGIGDGTAGSSGIVYFDDIRLYKPKTFNVNDYGADPAGVSDSGPAIRAAIADAVAAGAISVVKLGSGCYKVEPADGEGRCFPINAASNLVIQGQGTAETKLIVSDPRAGVFRLQGCDGVFLKDFSIDYNPLPFTQGTIVGKSYSSGYFDLDIDPCFPLLSESWFAEAEYKWGMIFEPDKPLLKAGAPDHVFINSWSHLHDRVWRLYPTDSHRSGITYMDIGDRFVHLARGGNHTVYFYGCRNSGIENVTVYAAPVCVAASVSNSCMIIRSLTVQRLPDSARLLSTNADAYHCQRNRRGTLIEDCYFNGMADDGLNIYTIPNIVTEVISTTELRVTSAGLIRKFDFLQIMNPRAGTILDEVTAVDITGDVVTLEHPVVGVTAGTDHTNADTIFNLSSCGQGYVIRNNHMIGHRRHGILLRAGGGLVEGNLIEEVSGLGIVVTNEPGWPEGPMAQNITIRNNTIADVGYGLWFGGYSSYGAAIKIKGEKLWGGLAGGHVQRQIYIEDNEIINAPGAAIFVGAAHNVWITGNSSEALPGAPSYRNTGAILLDNCGGVVINDFTVNDNRSQTIAAVEIESSVDPGEAGVSISNLQGNKTNVIDHR
jgi:hypothetical protein